MSTTQYIASPEKLDATDILVLDQLIEQYPYCATYRMLRSIALANVHSTSLNEAVKQTATYLTDRTSLFHRISNGEYGWEELLQRLKEKQKRHEETADDFLCIDQYLEHLHLPASDPTIGSYDLSTLQNLNPGIDLADELEEEEETSANDAGDDTLSLIDSFLSAEAEGQLFTPIAPPAAEVDNATEELKNIRDRAILSESLAKVYVKQHKYEQALAIFSSLNLQYSKKSSYFADQIRFLEKVIAYQKESKTEELV